MDSRFSDPEAHPATWEEVETILADAELYWITTVRGNGRPHVAPLVGLWHDGAFVFCTGEREQKYRNLEHAPYVAVTTGANTWQAGTDVVVEGEAVQVVGRATLQSLADTFLTKYGEATRTARPASASDSRLVTRLRRPPYDGPSACPAP